MLGPHRGVHRELVPVRVAPERLPDHLELVVAQPELPREVGRGRVGHRPAPAITDDRSDANSAWPPVGPDVGVDGVLGMRHESDHVAGLVPDPGDPAQGAVRVVGVGHGAVRTAVAEHDHPRVLEAVEIGLGGDELPLAVLDRDLQDLPGQDVGGDRGLRGLHPQVHDPADEPQRPVPDQRAGQQSRFAEDLEAVADAEDRTTPRREALDLLHHRREPGDRAAPQVVAVAESARAG